MKSAAPGQGPDRPRLRALRLRAETLAAIREFFREEGFLEVETPLLSPAADPAPYTESMCTTLHLPGGGERRLYLTTSPELFMKRLLAEGCQRIFQVCPFFRDGELGPWHHPQFTGLEWYQVGISLDQLMDFIERLVRRVAERLEQAGLGRERPAAWAGPFSRLTVHQACLELGGVRLPEDFGVAAVRAALRSAGIATSADDGLGDLVNRLLLNEVEPKLRQREGVFLHHYPAEMAALARLDPERPWLAERCELYLRGIELANGYRELCNAGEQRRRFEKHQEERRMAQRDCPPLDEEFLAALARGLPDCCGCALGVDRLVAVLGGLPGIEPALSFSLHSCCGQDRGVSGG